MKIISELNISGRRIFLRLDLNVPLGSASSSGMRSIEDDTRIQESLPTIQYAIQQGAKLVVASHLGRPGGKVVLDLSLEPVASHLASLLNQDVTLSDSCCGEGVELMVNSLKNGQILLLENLRFHSEEEKNGIYLSKQLSRLADVFITDAFGTAHRKHASTYGVPGFIPERGIGFLVEKEIRFLSPLLRSPKRPFFVLLGGLKVSDKIKTIESLLSSLDTLLIGGAMSHAFYVAQGKTLPENVKQPDVGDVLAAKSILDQAVRLKKECIVAQDFHDGFDIGPVSLSHFSSILPAAETLFWNGPMGWFENPPYDSGTLTIARFIATIQATKIVGGGDTVLAIKKAGVASFYDHLSTGGGASLEFLKGNGLPGLDILK